MPQNAKNTIKKLWAKVKKLHKSLTAWVNLTAFSLLPLIMDFKQQLPTIKDMLSEDVYKYAFIGLVVANILVRFHTSKPLDEK